MLQNLSLFIWKAYLSFYDHKQLLSYTLPLKTNILYYTEHTLSDYWFYDPVK